jgi:hypothetical protein
MSTETIEVMQTCAMCGGRFPGAGIDAGGKLYCCDKCADFHHHKLHMVAAMAPKLVGILSIGAMVGYFIGRNRNKTL